MGHVIAFTNHKGGVGKTTTAINIAYTLTRQKKKVLLVDADPQGNASTTIGQVPAFEQPHTIAELLTDKGMQFSSCAVPSKYKNLDLIPSNINAASLNTMLSPSDPMRFIGFRHKFDDAAKDRYDYILIDCPPTIDGPFLVNALVVSDFYVIPIEAESVYALAGVDALLKAIETITESTNPNLAMLGALITMYDARTQAGRYMSEAITDYFQSKVFSTRISRNTAINKANMLGCCVCDMDSSTKGCKDYRALAHEIVKRIQELESAS